MKTQIARLGKRLINWRDSLTRQLVLLGVGDTLHLDRFSTQGLVVRNTFYGFGIDADGSGRSIVDDSPIIRETDNFTVFFQVFRHSNSDVYGTVFGRTHQNGSSTAWAHYTFDFNPDGIGQGNVEIAYFKDDEEFVWDRFTVNALGFVSLAIVNRDDTPEVYINGNFVGGLTTSEGTVTKTNTNSNLMVGSNSASNELDTGANVLRYGLWRRAFSSAEMLTLHENPARLIVQNKKTSFFDTLSSAITGTGTLVSAAAQLSATGERTITATGALASNAATFTAVGERIATGSGTLVSGVSELSGSGKHEITGSGALSATVSQLSGSGLRIINSISATLQSAQSALVSSGVRQINSVLAGLISEAALLSAVGVVGGAIVSTSADLVAAISGMSAVGQRVVHSISSSLASTVSALSATGERIINSISAGLVSSASIANGAGKRGVVSLVASLQAAASMFSASGIIGDVVQYVNDCFAVSTDIDAILVADATDEIIVVDNIDEIVVVQTIDVIIIPLQCT